MATASALSVISKSRLIRESGLSAATIDRYACLGQRMTVEASGRGPQRRRRVFTEEDIAKALAIKVFSEDVRFYPREIDSMLQRLEVEVIRREFSRQSLPKFLEYLRGQRVEILETAPLKKFLKSDQGKVIS